MADLPKLKAAVAEGDPRTAEPVARDYRDRVRSDVLVLTDRDGRTLVVARGGRAPAGRTSPGLSGWSAGGSSRRSTPRSSSAPSPETLGHLVLGFALDDAFAARLRALTGSHVAVAMEGRVFASTLPRRHDAALLAAARRQGVARVDLEGEEHVAAEHGAGRGRDGAPRPRAALARGGAAPALARCAPRSRVAALVAVGLGLLLSWALARTVTRPLAALTDAMKRIAATGDLGLSLGPGRPWDDEDARLVARTFGALTDSIARFQREATLRERLSALGRLSTVIAHEVRNPLMIIKGSLRGLKRDGVAAEVREAAADIDHEVARLDRIVGDVLDFARPLRLERAPVDVHALARDAARAALEGADGIAARFALEPSAGTILTDGERLRGVLVNLIANARESLARRGPVERRGDRDRRPGPRSRGRRPLGGRPRPRDSPGGPRRTSSSRTSRRKRTGTGLGLAISRKVGGSARREPSGSRAARAKAPGSRSSCRPRRRRPRR